MGLALVLVDLFSRVECGELGLLAAGAAMVFNVRGFFCRLAERERNAFEIGRDFEAGMQEVRRVR